MNTTTFFIDALGWIGALLVLIAYGLLSIEWMSGNSLSYQSLNVAGAILLVINSYYLGAYPSVGVNVAWVGIALLTLFHDWWKGPSETYKKVKSDISRNIKLRKLTLQRIKLPALKYIKYNPKKDRAVKNGHNQPQLS
ncbi:MAG: hypothetical protein WCK35_07685 [Chloroflexota bacterium]|jgi:hypothetical protein